MNNEPTIKLNSEMVIKRVSEYLDLWFEEYSQNTGLNIENVSNDKDSSQIPFGAEFKGTNPYSSGTQDLDMSGLDLSTQDLHFSKFINSNLKNSDFSGSDLRFSQFVGCNLNNSNFENADLSWASISDCDLRGANFNQSDCYDITFIENETGKGITGRVHIPQDQHPLLNSLNFFSRPDPGKKIGRKTNPFHLPGDFRPPHTAAFAYHKHLVIEKYGLDELKVW